MNRSVLIVVFILTIFAVHPSSGIGKKRKLPSGTQKPSEPFQTHGKDVYTNSYHDSGNLGQFVDVRLNDIHSTHSVQNDKINDFYQLYPEEIKKGQFEASVSENNIATSSIVDEIIDNGMALSLPMYNSDAKGGYDGSESQQFFEFLSKLTDSPHNTHPSSIHSYPELRAILNNPIVGADQKPIENPFDQKTMEVIDVIIAKDQDQSQSVQNTGQSNIIDSNMNSMPVSDHHTRIEQNSIDVSNNNDQFPFHRMDSTQTSNGLQLHGEGNTERILATQNSMPNMNLEPKNHLGHQQVHVRHSHHTNEGNEFIYEKQQGQFDNSNFGQGSKPDSVSFERDASAIINDIIRDELVSTYPLCKSPPSCAHYDRSEAQKFNDFLLKLNPMPPESSISSSETERQMSNSKKFSLDKWIPDSTLAFLTVAHRHRPQKLVRLILEQLIPKEDLATMTATGYGKTRFIPQEVRDIIEDHLRGIYGDEFTHAVFMKKLAQSIAVIQKQLNVKALTRRE